MEDDIQEVEDDRQEMEDKRQKMEDDKQKDDRQKAEDDRQEMLYSLPNPKISNYTKFIYRNPWKSYLHQLWMKKHEIFENWPNTLVALPKYVTEVEQVLSADNELRLASTDEFCSEHSYSYEKPFWVKFVHKVRKPFRRIKSTTQTSGKIIQVINHTIFIGKQTTNTC